MRTGVGYDKTLRVLGPLDPTFRTLKDNSRTLNELCGCNFEFTLLPLDELHEALLDNSRARISRFDVVSFDLPWIGELSEKQVVLPLDKIIETARYNASDFHTAAWKGSRYGRHQYGIPIQPTTELLFYRSDMFAQAGLDAPATTEDVLLAAKTLHKSRMDMSGIVMNYGPGLPVAHSFIQTMADFGVPVINLRRVGSDYDASSISGAEFRPMVDSEAGRQAAEYLRALLDYAHPESLKCTWDRRIGLFSDGHAAMTYGWSIRAAAFELDTKSKAYGKVSFVAHPGGSPGHRVSPIGGFGLAIPANLEKDRVPNSWKVMEYLARPEMMKWYVQNGNLTSPRYSTSADPEVRSFSPMIQFLDGMERRGETQIWPRPPIPEINGILAILGVEIHRMLRGETRVADALSSSQKQIDEMMRANGRY
nr:extracellular solute-binding protein [Pseudohoeflea sp. DP4N28-3]